MTGRDPFDPVAITKSMDNGSLENLILALDDLSRRVQMPERQNAEWQLPTLAPGERPAYVAPGPWLDRRTSHAALFADHVLVPPPTLPALAFYDQRYDVADVFRNRRQLSKRDAQTPTNQAMGEPPRPDLPPEVARSLDEIIAEIDAEGGDIISDAEGFVGHLNPRWLAQSLPLAATDLLRYWWNVSDAVDDGWLHIVRPGWLNSDNIKAIAKDAEFRAELENLMEAYRERYSFESWRDLMTATGLAHEFGRTHILTFPSDRLTRDLIALTSRYYTELPYGGTLVGLSYPTRRLHIAGGGEVERGAWFDEVMLGLGPAANLLDLHTVRELRNDGTAAALRHWITEELNRAAFAAARGDNVDDVLAEASHRLGLIAAAADARINSTGSDVTRERLKQAGIWGGSGLLAGFVGTLATGGTLPVAAVVAGIGFALSGLAGAATTTGGNASAEPDPVIYDLMAHLRAKQ
jgi:hypothetical protein